MSYPSLPNIVPTSVQQLRQDYAVTQISLGASYQQRIALGLGGLPLAFDVSWDYISYQEKARLAAFFDDRKGYGLFFFSVQDGIQNQLVTCEYWSQTGLSRGFWNMRARFRSSP